MSKEVVFTPTTRIPWFKVISIGTGIAGSVGGAVYLWTSRNSQLNHELALAKKEIALLDTKKKLIETEKEEQRECDKEPIWYNGSSGCLKVYK